MLNERASERERERASERERARARERARGVCVCVYVCFLEYMAFMCSCVCIVASGRACVRAYGTCQQSAGIRPGCTMSEGASP